MSKRNNVLRILPLLLPALLLVGLFVSLAALQAAAAEPPTTLNQANQVQLGPTAAKLIASDGAAGDAFGWSAAVSGDVVVIGAFGNDDRKGAAYVFVKPSGGWSGTLTETAKLIASDRAGFDHFGYSVGIEGDTIVIGAPDHDTYRGASYVFVKPSSGWSGVLTETVKLIALDGVTGDLFGDSVAASNDTVVVGADGDDANQGSAYVFVKPNSGWSGALTETAKLIASDGVADDFLGTSARISNDTIVVGSRGDDGFKGSAYVFVKPVSGWNGALTETAKLIASDGATNDFFGAAVAISGDTIVSGALFHNIGPNNLQGAAYVFAKPDSGWSGVVTETAKLVASDGIEDDRLGEAVAISGDTVLATTGNNNDQELAYLFTKPDSGWSGVVTETTTLTTTEGITGGQFDSIAIDGQTIVATEFYNSVNDSKPAIPGLTFLQDTFPESYQITSESGKYHPILGLEPRWFPLKISKLGITGSKLPYVFSLTTTTTIPPPPPPSETIEVVYLPLVLK